MSRRDRVGGGSTFRSEAPTPVSRRFTPAPSVECSPPPSSHRTPKAGRRASSGSGTPKPETYTPGGSTLQPPRSSARFGNSPALAEFSERRSTGRRSQQPTTRSILEARVNAEVGDIFKQVDADCGFNKADEQESYEARKIIEEGLADKKGAVEYQHRIRDVDLDGDGQIDESEKFVNQRSTLALTAKEEVDPVEDGTWVKNVNHSLKWWQGLPQTVTKEIAEERGLVDLKPSHPAYFQMRRQAPGMDYIKKPAYATHSELLEARKKGRVPDQSYDLDGDGCVGQREMFMAARLDKDVSGSLSLEEKRIGLANMRKDMAAVMFVDNAGIAGDRMAGNQYRILQQDGKIVLDQE